MDILWFLEIVLAGTTGFLIGIAVTWRIIYWDTLRSSSNAKDPPAEPPWIECETCGSITSHFVDGMCAVCQRVFRK